MKKIFEKTLDKRERVYIMQMLKGFSGIWRKKDFDGGKRTNGQRKRWNKKKMGKINGKMKTESMKVCSGKTKRGLNGLCMHRR